MISRFARLGAVALGLLTFWVVVLDALSGGYELPDLLLRSAIALALCVYGVAGLRDWRRVAPGSPRAAAEDPGSDAQRTSMELDHREPDPVALAYRFAQQHPLYEEDNLWWEQALLFAGYQRHSELSDAQIHGVMYETNRALMRLEARGIVRAVDGLAEGEELEEGARAVLQEDMLPRLARLTSVMTFHRLESAAGEEEKRETMAEAERAARLFGGVSELSKALAAYGTIFKLVQAHATGKAAASPSRA